MSKTAESVLKSARENNEPVFVLRAKDWCSINAIYEYLEFCRAKGCDIDFRNEILNIIEDFEKWQEENKLQVKKPD